MKYFIGLYGTYFTFYSLRKNIESGVLPLVFNIDCFKETKIHLPKSHIAPFILRDLQHLDL